MGVDVSNSAPKQRVAVNVQEHLRIRRNHRGGQAQECVHHILTAAQVAERDFANDKRMRENLSGVETRGKHGVGGAQVVHPYRRVDRESRDNRPAPWRRLKIGFAAAKTRKPTSALSLDQRLSASRTRPDFSSCRSTLALSQPSRHRAQASSAFASPGCHRRLASNDDDIHALARLGVWDRQACRFARTRLPLASGSRRLPAP